MITTTLSFAGPKEGTLFLDEALNCPFKKQWCISCANRIETENGASLYKKETIYMETSIFL